MAGPTYTYRARLIRVVDGDTVVLEVDLGFRMRAELPVRLLGINTPERNEAGWREATAWTADWFAGRPAVVVTTEKNPEKYGRWLGVITAPGEPVSLNDALVSAGRAVPYRPG